MGIVRFAAIIMMPDPPMHEEWVVRNQKVLQLILTLVRIYACVLIRSIMVVCAGDRWYLQVIAIFGLKLHGHQEDYLSFCAKLCFT